MGRRDNEGDYTPPRNDLPEILLVDDCPEYARAFLRSFPAGERGLRVKATGEIDDLFQERAPKNRLVLLDIDLGPGLPDGISVLKRLREAGRRDRVVMLSCDETSETLSEAIFASADGYMVKGIFGRRLRRDVERICRETATGDYMFHAYLGSRRLRLDQRELLERFAEAGYPLPKELGFDLGRSENAIHKSLARIRRRLELENNAQLVHLLTVLSGYSARCRTAGRFEE